MPKRIISLAPSITHALYALGAEENVVGITKFCPKGTTPKEVIGTIWEPNLEKIIELSPDLVIATKEGNKKEPVFKLKELNIKVLILDEDRSYKDICRNFLTIAEAIDKKPLAEKIIRDSDKILSEVGQKGKGRKPVTVFWQIGSRPLFTVSGNNFINEMTVLSGGRNIFEGTTKRYFQVSEEEVVKRDPDAILVVFMGDIATEEAKKWDRFGTLKAVREKRVVTIAEQEFFAPMPMTFALGVRKIEEILHSLGKNENK